MEERIIYLLKKYLEQDITDREQAELASILVNDAHADAAKNAIFELMLVSPGEELAQEQHSVRRIPIRRIMRYAAGFAAAIGIASLFFYRTHQSANPKSAEIAQTDSHSRVVPGTDKAILVLEDNTYVHLDKYTKPNSAASAAGYTYNQQELVYNNAASTGVNNQHAPIYHKIIVPKGGQYRVTLPDGTRVWLNADTELRYPVGFTADERIIELSGEAYFEVSDDKHKPFHIRIDGKDHIQVLGTHFNINSYKEDNQIKTSLYEGAVRITGDRKTVLLRPGQQSVADKVSHQLAVRTLQSTDDMAWRDGYFVFDGETIQGIMRKISRWYDVEVEYRNTPTREFFHGTISRFGQISDVLKMLELTGLIKFNIQGRRIIVMTT